MVLKVTSRERKCDSSDSDDIIIDLRKAQICLKVLLAREKRMKRRGMGRFCAEIDGGDGGDDNGGLKAARKRFCRVSIDEVAGCQASG